MRQCLCRTSHHRLTLGKELAEGLGDIALLEIAFPSRQCDKTGHRRQ
jgi:hypothetical protein